MNDIRLLTWNVHKGKGRERRRDTRRVLDVIAGVSPDVAVLQEVDFKFRSEPLFLIEEIREVTGMEPCLPSAAAYRLGWHGNLLLAKPHIDFHEAVPIRLPHLEPRGAVIWGLSAEGVRFDVVGMHLALLGIWRRLQVIAVASAIANRPSVPTVVAGDTNVWRRGETTLAPLEMILDCSQLPVATFPARRPIFPLDRVLTGRGAHLRELKVESDGMASDHMPVVSTISLAA